MSSLVVNEKQTTSVIVAASRNNGSVLLVNKVNETESINLKNVSPVIVTSTKQGPPGPASIVLERYEIETPSLIWTIQYDPSYSDFISVNMYNTAGTPMHAGRKFKPNHILEFYLTEAMSGYVDIIFGLKNKYNYERI
jgi:hypothetical protein